MALLLVIAAAGAVVTVLGSIATIRVTIRDLRSAFQPAEDESPESDLPGYTHRKAA